MPNRKTFDERERYDHSGRPLGHRQANDLKPGVVGDEEPRGADSPADRATGERRKRRSEGR